MANYITNAILGYGNKKGAQMQIETTIIADSNGKYLIRAIVNGKAINRYDCKTKSYKEACEISGYLPLVIRSQQRRQNEGGKCCK